jgi:hypothetical protein
MDILSGDISVLVFKRVLKGDIGEFSLDSQMLKVLMELDGKKNLGAIAGALNMNLKTIRDAVGRLQRLQLVEMVQKETPMMGKDFFDFLSGQLSIAMGPIAEVLIEDELQEMGLDPVNIPRHRAAELVDLLARQIPREEKRIEFQQALLKKIKQSI